MHTVKYFIWSCLTRFIILLALSSQFIPGAGLTAAGGQTIISRTLAALTLKIVQLRNVYVKPLSKQSK